jgi:hypothetical protein
MAMPLGGLGDKESRAKAAGPPSPLKPTTPEPAYV